ncbi:hypothetical protein C1645_836670 [Glomus cerebriforme]|uniref:Uncharacterized protein n=1 Tax=Glomus cerebriforme TaxID=658196 RepID=A0A397SA83_9GLOM|nr:hypothetical protein C1645_836670 [Glomus cerebriforme]
MTYIQDLDKSFMSDDHNGAIVLFNKMNESNSIRIGCGLHIMHIVFNNFEKVAFGKLSSTIGFTKIAHPYNLAYLVCDASDKDKPLDITGKKIQELCQEYLLNIKDQFEELFARSFVEIIMDKCTNEEVVKYADELYEDIVNFNINDFGLSELLLKDDYFRHVFEEFCILESPLLYHYPCLYEFIKTKIYFIIIHQQQVEGLFYKLNLKAHPNMTADLKESKMIKKI